MIDENLWRAIRFGLEGRMIDIDRGKEYASAALPDRLLAWTAPARGILGIEPAIGERTGAQRQREAVEAGASIRDAFAAEVGTTQSTYEAEGVTT